MLNVLRRIRERRALVRELYQGIVRQSRQTGFFRDFGVPDTLDGRFDLQVLHAWLVLAQLKEQGAQDLAQRLTDAIFVGFDEGLRDMGAGDMGIGKRVKKMANAFYGRLQAYDAAGSDAALMAETLLRNIYRGVPDHADQAHCLSRYVLAARTRLATADIKDGKTDFGPLP